MTTKQTFRGPLSILTLAAVFALPGCMFFGRANPHATPVNAEATHAANSLYHEGLDFQTEGLLNAALASFGLALEENPSLTDAHLGMGHLYRLQGNFNFAENAYKRAVKTDNKSYDANYYLGLTYQLQGKIENAINQYLRAIVIAPERLEANRDITAAYIISGSPDTALTYAETAVKLDPQSQAAWCNLATTCNLLGYYERAIDAYRQAAELGQLSDTILPQFANAHIKLKNYNRAVNVLTPLAARSNNPLVLERLAFAHFKLREFTDALEYYEKSLASNPADTASLNGIGACYMTKFIQSGRKNRDLKTKAYDAWRRSLNINTKQPQIADLLVRYKNL